MNEPVTIVDRNVLKILSVDTRMDILKELSQGSRTPADLGRKLKKSDATIVEHLDKMCRAGLVRKIEQPGRKWIFYTLTDRGEGVVSSKSRRLVIILGISILSAVSGFAGFFSYTFQGYSSRMESVAKSVPSALGADSVAQAVQAPWLLYVYGFFIAASFAGIAYYFVKKRSMRVSL